MGWRGSQVQILLSRPLKLNLFKSLHFISSSLGCLALNSHVVFSNCVFSSKPQVACVLIEYVSVSAGSLRQERPLLSKAPPVPLLLHFTCCLLCQLCLTLFLTIRLSPYWKPDATTLYQGHKWEHGGPPAFLSNVHVNNERLLHLQQQALHQPRIPVWLCFELNSG